MRNEPALARAIPLYHGDSNYSSWSDIPGSETIPWGKIAIGTNDGGSTSNRIYMIDGAVPSPATHVDLSYWVAPVNIGYFYAGDHGSHVAGILAAAANNVAVRGVNPAASDLVVVYRGDTPSDIATAFDWVLADAEQDQVYGVLNFSTNGWLFSEYNTNNINSVLRRVSTRVLIVQAAGNQHQDACNEAQGGGGRTNSADGILVVGGIDESGAEGVPFDNTSVWPGVWEPGSNYGPCVELWAPSLHVKSTWNTSSTAVVSLSGTSMAAPHVVALAARYGSNATTPVERERWIHGKTFWTGSYSQSGQPILVPSYTQTLTTNVGGRLFPLSSSADATIPGTSTSYLSDGLYLTNTWNAGHYAPGWVEFDLGSSRVITAIRAVPEQYPAGSVVHHVYAGNTPNPTGWVGTLSGPAAMMEPLATTVGTYARYVRIHSSSSPSFVAWREIEIYGY